MESGEYLFIYLFILPVAKFEQQAFRTIIKLLSGARLNQFISQVSPHCHLQQTIPNWFSSTF